jgi:hypothetical protein
MTDLLARQASTSRSRRIVLCSNDSCASAACTRSGALRRHCSKGARFGLRPGTQPGLVGGLEIVERERTLLRAGATISAGCGSD